MSLSSIRRGRWLVAALCLGLTPGCSRPADSVDERIAVAVSVPPQAYLVDRVGGERVEVEVMVPPGTAADAYEPTPRQMAAVSEARLYVEVGHPDFPLERRHLDPVIAARHIEVVDMAAGAAAGGDPHLWVSPRVMAATARRVAAALARIDPAHADVYETNLDALLADVEALDRDLRSALSGLENRRFLVQHPAWGHFAAEYGLEQWAIERDGKEPGPAALAGLIERARAADVRTVFVQRGVSDRAARAVARELGARVVEIDPLAYDWPENLRRVAEALRGELYRPASGSGGS